MKTIYRLSGLSFLAVASTLLSFAFVSGPANATERTLAGVRTFSPIIDVLKLYGDPKFITAGTVVATVTFTPVKPTLYDPTGSGASNSPYNSDTGGPGMGGQQQGGPGMGQFGQQGGPGMGGQYGQPRMPGQQGGPSMGSGSQLPGGIGGSGGFGGPGGMGGQGGMGAADAGVDQFDLMYDRCSRYYYDDTKKGLILEFVATNAGRVVEIKLYGYHSQFKTSQGIGLGSNYEQIVMKYGYPEKTINDPEPSGDILTLIYNDSAHVSFRLVKNKVAVISVIAPD